MTKNLLRVINVTEKECKDMHRISVTLGGYNSLEGILSTLQDKIHSEKLYFGYKEFCNSSIQDLENDTHLIVFKDTNLKARVELLLLLLNDIKTLNENLENMQISEEEAAEMDAYYDPNLKLPLIKMEGESYYVISSKGITLKYIRFTEEELKEAKLQKPLPKIKINKYDNLESLLDVLIAKEEKMINEYYEQDDDLY